MHRANLDTGAATNTVVRSVEWLVGNEVSAEECAKHISLEPRKGTAFNVHHLAA